MSDEHPELETPVLIGVIVGATLEGFVVVEVSLN